MAESIFIYDAIYGSSFFSEKNKVTEIVKQIIGVPKEEDLHFKINTPGGVVDDGMSIVSNICAHKGIVNMSVEGLAASMGAWLLAYANHAEASDVSRIMIHKAYYNGYREITEEIQTNLDNMNRNQKNAFLKRGVNKELIEKIFDKENNSNFWFTAQQAKKAGIIDKVNKTGRTSKPIAADINDIEKMNELYPFWNKENVTFMDDDPIFSNNNEGTNIMKDVFNKQAVEDMRTELTDLQNKFTEFEASVTKEIKNSIETALSPIAETLATIKASITKPEAKVIPETVAKVEEVKTEVAGANAKADEAINAVNKVADKLNEVVDQLSNTVTTFNAGKTAPNTPNILPAVDEDEAEAIRNSERNKTLNEVKEPIKNQKQ